MSRRPEAHPALDPDESIDVTFDETDLAASHDDASHVRIESLERPSRLVRAITCISPPRLGRRSRATELALELAAFVPRAALVTGAALLITGLATGPRRMVVFSESKADVAKATVLKYALEAYPSWLVQHPNAACPDRLEDLNEYMNNKDISDPWRGVYEMSCTDFGILVWTAGEDGRAGTSDDIRSDE